MFRYGFRPIVLTLLTIVMLQGCYGYRVQVSAPDPVTEPEQTIAHSLFWGLLQVPQDVVAQDCLSNALDEVYITSNYAYAFATVVTLGVWAPLNVEWRCAERSADDGSDDGEI